MARIISQTTAVRNPNASTAVPNAQFAAGRLSIVQPRMSSMSLPKSCGRGHCGGFDRTMRFYSEVPGFTGRVAQRHRELRGYGFREMHVRWTPAAPKDAHRKPVHSAIYDPGSGVLPLRIDDFDAVVRALEVEGQRLCQRAESR